MYTQCETAKSFLKKLNRASLELSEHVLWIPKQFYWDPK